LGRAGIGAILDYSVEGQSDEAGFEETKTALLEIIELARDDPHIPCTCLKVTGIGSFQLLEKVTAGTRLSPPEAGAWKRLRQRLDTICRASREVGKPIYIDAEETWIQGAVDRLAEEMMARYNRERSVVFTTLQMYRRDRIPYLAALIQRAETDAYRVGIKIVRGAYMEKERERARLMGYPSPINETKTETDREYNKALVMAVAHIDTVELCLGTHNEHSCRLLAHCLARQALPNNHPHVCFSQLYGMSDHVSFNLARAGYNVSKYLPFGPVASTLPYLARRAEENTAIAGQMSKELEIIIRERRRRKTTRHRLSAA
jgi:proline dehydrogenase